MSISPAVHFETENPVYGLFYSCELLIKYSFGAMYGKYNDVNKKNMHIN